MSRAALIPITHNYPGFADGIAGADLLRHLRLQAGHYGVTVEGVAVTALDRQDEVFEVSLGASSLLARSVILATGVEDLKPDIPEWREATLASIIRWCPICDGYEAIDKSIALIADAQMGFKHALFLRTYTRNLSLFVQGESAPLTARQRDTLSVNGIAVFDSRIRGFSIANNLAVVRGEDGKEHRFDAVYPMVGCAPRVELLKALAPRLDENNLLWVDEHQASSVSGLYAAGDVVHALNQMSVGTAHAATAATAVHHALPPNYR
jgi:thioredoxin reductase (NADPH)